ncbi:hypothetical protein NDU88_006965 [Pleurodeles waltl]|uniref:Uncharacterized protein n=1 Tax=Pleurodeles waltl TaxID=8319 RepID=A0AAV7QJ95_PLEWA|nr:hypothetical protein NDU88_006965 [Pleurodeles waltl]
MERRVEILEYRAEKQSPQKQYPSDQAAGAGRGAQYAEVFGKLVETVLERHAGGLGVDGWALTLSDSSQDLETSGLHEITYGKGEQW